MVLITCQRFVIHYMVFYLSLYLVKISPGVNSLFVEKRYSLDILAKKTFSAKYTLSWLTNFAIDNENILKAAGYMWVLNMPINLKQDRISIWIMNEWLNTIFLFLLTKNVMTCLPIFNIWSGIKGLLWLKVNFFSIYAGKVICNRIWRITKE